MKYTSQFLAACSRDELPEDGLIYALGNAVDFLDRYFQCPESSAFRDFRLLMGLRKYKTSEEIHKNLQILRRRMIAVLNCHPDKGYACFNTTLCPHCNKMWRAKLYGMAMEFELLKDKGLELYAHQRVYELPRGVFGDSFGIKMQLGRAYLPVLSKKKRDELFQAHLGCYYSAFKAPDMLLQSASRIIEGKHLYDSGMDSELSKQELYTESVKRFNELKKRISKCKTPDEKDSVFDALRIERHNLNVKSDSCAGVNRITIAPVVPSSSSPVVRLLRVYKNTLLVMRKEVGAQFRKNALGESDNCYRIHPFYPDMESSVFYRTSQKYVRKRVNTPHDLYRLIVRMFPVVNNQATFLPEEFILYTFAMDFASTQTTGWFTERN